jgi:amidase
MSVRSTFGGTVCNPYDTERSPITSSSGAGAAVSANLVTCAIGEETGISIRGPAAAASLVGLVPTQELTSRDGMIGAGINTHVGPICRTVEDAARLLTIIAGYDPKDPLTVFSIDRKPAQPYESFAREQRLDGIRIGVAREYLEKGLFGKMDAETIDIINRAVGDLRALGATVVDPGPNGTLFQGCINTYAPPALNAIYTKRFPALFPVDERGKPIGNHVTTLAELAADPSRVPEGISLRDFGAAPALGEEYYSTERYLKERGDSAIKNNADYATKANTLRSEAGSPRGKEPTAMDMSSRILLRFAVQQIVLQCMAELHLDVVTYATSNIPPLKILAPEEAPVKGRETWQINSGSWTLFGHQGFPVISVPAGFTTQVYDIEINPAAPAETVEVGPTAARLPVGIDFAGRPFDEPTLFRVASAYVRATKHRQPPPDFGPLTTDGLTTEKE